jgi:hypothetical protein
MARWATIGALKRGWFKFWHDSRQVPRKVWQRWAGSLALALGLCGMALNQREINPRKWPKALICRRVGTAHRA